MDVKGKYDQIFPKVVNIEVGHVYGDRHVCQEQEMGVSLGSMLALWLGYLAIDNTMNVWIDNYNSPCKDDHRFASEVLGTWPYNKTKICHYAFEADCVKPCEEFLATIPDCLKKVENKGSGRKKVVVKAGDGRIGVKEIVGKKDKFTCAALSATYALAKLGKIEIPTYAAGRRKMPFGGEVAVTVLPNYDFFVESERKAKELIFASEKFSDCADKLYYVWFDPVTTYDHRNITKLACELQAKVLLGDENARN